MSAIKLVNVVGARPNFMKIAPLAAAFERHGGFEQVLVHTGQHYDENLSRVFFDELGIPKPDIDLGIGGGDRRSQIERIEAAFRPVVERERPDAVLVVGDVNSTIACATVAREAGVAVVHVEAGLRSFDLDMPEEHNRLETDRIADYLFVTEPAGMDNIQREALRGKAFLVGNVMIDTLVGHLERAGAHSVRDALGVRAGQYMVATFHRPSNVDARDSLGRVVAVLEAVCARNPTVLPLHPRTAGALERHGLRATLDDLPGLHLCEPLGYLSFLDLVGHARGVLTDSGGLQEETTYLRIPCITMRENTERPITVDIGTNRLLGMDHARIVAEVDRIVAGRFGAGEVPELWDGRSAERIAAILAGELAPG